MLFNVVGLLIGLMILIGGIYYLVKEKEDQESKKIYSVITGAGVVVVLVFVIKILVLG